MIDLTNLQALLVKPCVHPLFTVMLFHIEDAAAARKFIRQWRKETPNGAEQGVGTRPHALYFMFSWQGLEKLLAGHPTLKLDEGARAFEPFFSNPADMPEMKTEQLGFLGPSAPDGWWEGKFKGLDIDVAIYGCFADGEAQDATMRDIRASATETGLRELSLDSFPQKALSGKRPKDGILHFGFRDGITQIDVDWEDKKIAGKVDLRQFVLGYPSDVYRTAPYRPGPWQDFARDGCFSSLTWIHQDVAAFNRFLRDNAPAVTASGVNGDPQEWLAAKLMGRWRDGSPLAKYPASPPAPAVLADDFGYADDPKGLKCPLMAHIRMVNGRDQPLTFANEARFPDGPPRLMRRGFSYGAPLDGFEDDGAPRGLIGVFLCARLNEQFYTVLRWTQEASFSDFFRNYPDGKLSQDSIVGNRLKPNAKTDAHIPLSKDRALTIGLANFMKYCGVRPFLTPSMRSLAILAGEA